MNCPFCNAHSSEIKVIDTRQTKKLTRRRRECLTCNERFSTMEFVTVDGETVTDVDILLIPKKSRRLK